MSKLRHCDRHDGDFSERAEDWSEWRGTVHSRYENGAPNDITESLDFCPPCTSIMRGVKGITDPLGLVITPAIAAPRVKDMRVDAEEYQKYMDFLEREALKPEPLLADEDIITPEHELHHETYPYRQ